MKKIFLILISFFIYINNFAQDAGPNQIRPCDNVFLSPVETSGWWITTEPNVIIVNSIDPYTRVDNLNIGQNVFRWYIAAEMYDEVTITRIEANANTGTDETLIKTCGTEIFLNAEHPAGVNGEWIMVNGGGLITDNTYFHTEVTNLSYTNINSFEWKISQGICYDVDIVDVMATEDLYLDPPSIDGTGNVCSGAEIEYTTPNTDGIFDEFNWYVSGGEIVYESHPLRDTIHIMWHNDAGEYFINLNAIYGGCIAENNYPIKFGVGNKPELIRKGENLLICLDSGMINYRWFKNEQEIHGEGQQFYYSENLSGNYFVETQAQGCGGKSNILSISTKKAKLFPNPVVDIINIEINNEIKGNVLFSIKDLTGKTIKTHSVQKETNMLNTQIPINGIKQGVYTIDIIIKNKKYSSGRLIVQ